MPIQIDLEKKIFLCSTDKMSYAFGIAENGLPVNLHWGGKIEDMDDLPSTDTVAWFRIKVYNIRAKFGRYEYAPAHLHYCYEPHLKLLEPDRLLELKYRNHTLIDENHLVISLFDEATSLTVNLHYELFPEFDLIRRHVEVVNGSDAPVRIETLFSAAWSMPRGKAPRLTTLQGEWGQEYRVRRAEVTPGQRVLESRIGISSHATVPFFAFDPGNADEKSGDVHFGTLLWSGDWKFIVERDVYGETRVFGGLNNYDFELVLQPGEHFETPRFLAGFTRGGFGEMTRTIHRWSAKQLCSGYWANRPRPVVFNTFSCIRRTELTEQGVLDLIPKAAEVGCELFIIDDGWQTDVGTWTVHPQKFPNGLRKIAESVRAHGMKFGLWMEFEVIVWESPSWKEHEEWMLGEGAAQLNLAREDVIEYLYGTISSLIRENGLAYFKMDMNHYLMIPAIQKKRRELKTKYMLNFYRLMERLNKEFPHVIFENCASGSGRCDLAMDRYFCRTNRSDNQDTLDVLDIEEGYSYLHHPRMAGGGCQISKNYTYVINHRVIPLSFMAHAALMGWPSLGINLNESSPEEIEECKGYLALNRKIRHIIAAGELYRLASWHHDRYAAFEFVLPDKSEALLFVFSHALQYGEQLPNILLQGLDPRTSYAVECHGKKTAGDFYHKFDGLEAPARLTGRGLAEIGIHVPLEGDFDSRIYHLKALK